MSRVQSPSPTPIFIPNNFFDLETPGQNVFWTSLINLYLDDTEAFFLPPSLSVRIPREFFFSVILRKSEETLGRILGRPVSKISCVLPPGVKKDVPDIEGQFLGAGFSGAYASIADFPESLCHVGYVEMAAYRGRPFAYFSGGRSRNTKLLTASLAIAAATLVGSPIEDSGHHWIKKDEHNPDELLAAMIELASIAEPEKL